MGREMESGCCVLGPFGCRAVGAALGTAVWVMLCFRATFCGVSVSQGGGSGCHRAVAQSLGIFTPPCPLPQKEGAPWQVPGLGVPVTGNGAGWDWVGWGISRFLPEQKLPQALALSPISQSCSFMN